MKGRKRSHRLGRGGEKKKKYKRTKFERKGGLKRRTKKPETLKTSQERLLGEKVQQEEF